MRAVHYYGTEALLAVMLTQFALLRIFKLAALIKKERPLFLELFRIPLCRSHLPSKNRLLSVRFLTFLPL